MIKFLLKKVLKRSILIPLSWTLIYPSITGNLIVKNPSLGTPAVYSAKKAKVNVSWTTLLDEVIIIDSLVIEEAAGTFTFRDPLLPLRCLTQ